MLRGSPFMRLAGLLALILLLGAVGPGAAGAATVSPTKPVDPNTPVLVSNLTQPPAGYHLTALQVRRIAARAPRIADELRRHRHLIPYEYTKGPGRWQVSWFSPGAHGREMAQVYVSDPGGQVLEAWTGFQVAWTMARGYAGAFGRKVNALYVWLPMCVLFFLAFVPRPRRWRGASGGWSILHLDLAVLLAFSVSLAFFNHANLGISVPLVTPCLLYLLVRLLGLAYGYGRPRGPLPLLLPPPWLAVGVVFLVGFRVGLNLADSNVIDVGYAGVIGADKIVHGHALYGGWPSDNSQGDTYGPVNYLVYVPFRLLLGWSGHWDSLPAAHGAAIAFDLLTMFGLFLLGRRLRGTSTGIVLAYAWAAFPFTLYALSSNSNDSLVAMLVVGALLALGSAPGRGIMACLAGLAKFAPLALAPLFLRGTDERLSVRRTGAYIAAFWLTALVVMLPVLLHHDLRPFWRDTISYQANRPAPFSPWGLYGGLSLEQHIWQALTVVLAVSAMFLPRRRDLIGVAALAGAILIALQLGLSYWFYLYIPWFYAPLVAAVFGAHQVEGDPVLSDGAPARAAPRRLSATPVRA